MTIDPLIIKFVGWLLGFLFASLVAIIVWLAKGLLKKINSIIKNQESDTIERTSMKKDIDVIKNDLTDIKAELKDIPEIKEKIIRLESDKEHAGRDYANIKELLSENQKQITTLAEKINEQQKTIIQLQERNK